MNGITRRDFVATSAASSAALGSVLAALPASALGNAKKAKIKIGQIGTKHAHASGKMATMRKFSDDFEVVGVVEPDRARWAQLAKSSTYRGVPLMTERELLAVPGLQAVAVETDVSQLIATAERCIKAGLHVHLDKPAGESLRDFDSLWAAAESRERVIQMGYMYRYNPAFQFLLKAKRAGWLGDIFEISGVMSKKVGDETRRDIGRFPGGTMFELGCHIIDALVALMGPPQKVTPYVRRTRKSDNLADNQLAVFEYPIATATIRSAVVEVDGGRRRQFVVCGTRGTVDIRPLEPPRLTLTLDRDRGDYRKGTQTVELPKLGGRYDGDFIDLAKIIRGEKKTDYPRAHDIAAHKAILEASGVPLNKSGD